MHTLTVAMVLRNGVPYMGVGSMGGDGQPQIHVQVLSAMIDFGMNPQQAIAAPRWRSMRYNVDKVGKRKEMTGQRGLDEGARGNAIEMVLLEERFLSGIPLALDLLGHRIIVGRPCEYAMGHALDILIN